jgi:acyl transferase domain-containing protein
VRNGIAVQNGTPPPKLELLLLSANTPGSLSEQLRRYQDWIQHKPKSRSEMAYTRAVHREHLPHRTFAILDDRDFVETSSGTKAPPDSPDVIMIFSGQGAQWPEMGKELVLYDPNFQNDIQRMDQVLRTLSQPPCWNIMGEWNDVTHSMHATLL